MKYLLRVTGWMGQRFHVLVTWEVCREDSLDSFARAAREPMEPVRNPLLSVAEVPTHSAGAGPVFVKSRLIILRFLTQR